MNPLFSLLNIATSLLNAQSNHVAIAFTHVTVIDTRSASLQLDMTVVVTGYHIADLGKAAKVKVPRSARVIDRRGKFLMPGLCDMHACSTRSAAVHPTRGTSLCSLPTVSPAFEK